MISKEKYTAEFQRLSGQITEAENTPKPIDATEVKTLLQAYTGLSEAARKAFWSRLLTRIELDPEGENHALIYTNGYISHDILRFVKMRSFEKC